jgi:hypothetical protein
MPVLHLPVFILRPFLKFQPDPSHGQKRSHVTYGVCGWGKAGG